MEKAGLIFLRFSRLQFEREMNIVGGVGAPVHEFTIYSAVHLPFSVIVEVFSRDCGVREIMGREF